MHANVPVIQEVSPEAAFAALAHEAKALLIDVRTPGEWQQGITDLSSLQKQAHLIAWRLAPEMKINTEFVASIRTRIPALETPLYLLCRSGGRSYEAALELTAAGYLHCYNIVGGFEGKHSGNGQASLPGWKELSLPWGRIDGDHNA